MDREEKILYENLHGFDDKTVMTIAVEYPALYRAARERIMKLCVHKTPVSFFKVNNTKSDMQTVTGTEIYHRPLWRKYLSSVAAILLIAIGAGCMMYAGRNANINITPNSNNNMFGVGIAGTTESTSIEQPEKSFSKIYLIEPMSSSATISDVSFTECPVSETVAVTDITAETVSPETEIFTDCESVPEDTEIPDNSADIVQEIVPCQEYVPENPIPDNSIPDEEIPTEQPTTEEPASIIGAGDWYCLESNGTFIKYHFYENGVVCGENLENDMTYSADFNIREDDSLTFSRLTYNHSESTKTEVIKNGRICFCDDENFIIIWDDTQDFDIFSRYDFHEEFNSESETGS